MLSPHISTESYSVKIIPGLFSIVLTFSGFYILEQREHGEN